MRPMSTNAMVARYNDGFGQGDGKTYRPWLTASDVPSIGVTTVFKGRKTNREHTAFSNLERATIMVAQWSDHVLDIREQFPLWPLDETLAIAETLGVEHPSTRDGSRVVMTTDVLLTVEGGPSTFEPITVKPSSELGNKRVLEKLEIERVYWSNRDSTMRIVTEKELPESLVSNLRWMDEYYDITPETIVPSEIPQHVDHLFSCIINEPLTSLRNICSREDGRVGYPSGTSLAVARHALARKLWRVPLSLVLNPGQPLPVPTRSTSAMSILAARQ
jgi:hypothetical protein